MQEVEPQAGLEVSLLKFLIGRVREILWFVDLKDIRVVAAVFVVFVIPKEVCIAARS